MNISVGNGWAIKRAENTAINGTVFFFTKKIMARRSKTTPNGSGLKAFQARNKIPEKAVKYPEMRANLTSLKRTYDNKNDSGGMREASVAPTIDAWKGVSTFKAFIKI